MIKYARLHSVCNYDSVYTCMQGVLKCMILSDSEKFRNTKQDDFGE